jgi:hypothetical protein
MQLRIGTSTDARVRDAVAEAASIALSGCGSPAFALIFATPEYAADDVATALREAMPHVPCAGCVTPAIFAGHDVLQRGVAIGVIDSVRLRVRVGAASLREGARNAGRRAARAALQGMPLPPSDRSRAIILLADTTAGDAAEVIHGAVEVAGAGVAWGGGGTGDRAAQFADGRALRDHVVAITLDGHSRIGSGIQHGWQPTGAPAIVTRAVGPVVERLEHLTAFEIYRAAAVELGEHVEMEHFSAFAMTHPLGIPQADGEYLIRDPVAVDDHGALRFMAGIPNGALVRVMDGTPTMLIDAAHIAARVARSDAGTPLGGALVFDCVSRYMILRDGMCQELAACSAALGESVPLFGCLTFGEVGAFGARMPQFHNKTMVVLALPA